MFKYDFIFTVDKEQQVLQCLLNKTRMFNFLPFSKKKQNEFDLESSYMRIEFLTQDQKVKKDSALKKIQNQYEDDLQTIIPYESSFQCSHRLIFNSDKIKGKITLSQVMALLEVSSDQQFVQFYEANVQKIKLHMKDHKLVSEDNVLELYNERDVSLYNPPQILQIIYVQRGFFHRLKAKSTKFVKGIPKMMSNIVIKFIMMLLRSVGISSGKSIITKFLPFNMIAQWILNFLMLFFPTLAPLLGVGKMLI